jgi:hypothetical protein
MNHLTDIIDDIRSGILTMQIKKYLSSFFHLKNINFIENKKQIIEDLD